jgi:hypothetical protein
MWSGQLKNNYEVIGAALFEASPFWISAANPVRGLAALTLPPASKGGNEESLLSIAGPN